MCLNCVLIILGAYLVGSIPSGYWIAKYFYQIDITKSGSGNIGATNISRVLSSKKLFFLIFFLDTSKAFLYMNFISLIFSELNQINFIFLATALLTGNMLSIFLNFNGGKGVSTFVGIISFFSISFAATFIGIWVLSLTIFKRSGTASLIAAAAIPISYATFSQNINSPLLFFLILTTAVIFERHKKNIISLFSRIEGLQ
jgi:acyl phosphate:glycerol-3-phosphate acyltransferase